MANSVKKIYEGTKFCGKHGDNEITILGKQTRVVRQRYSLCLRLFNTFIKDVIEYINIVIPMLH
jgi:hypothetical protein